MENCRIRYRVSVVEFQSINCTSLFDICARVLSVRRLRVPAVPDADAPFSVSASFLESRFIDVAQDRFARIK